MIWFLKKISYTDDFSISAFMAKMEDTAAMCEINCAYGKFVNSITGRGLIAEESDEEND